jgi:hypothetical protein
MPMTFEKLNKLVVERAGALAFARAQRETAAMNGQVLRTGHSDGRRTAEAYGSTRYVMGKPVESAVGMSGDAHVCRNLKTARRKPTPPQKYRPTPPREAFYCDADGRPRECGSTTTPTVAAVRRSPNDERMMNLVLLFGENHPRVRAIREAMGV